ncbi:MAG: shikimate kinase [Planctomycetota bacterium]|nr:MAG: shikimate kinase [Planctomycetota bacterium]
MVITLIGYRGTGKSTVAPLLAAQLGWNWVDADVEIETRTGESIAAIFAREGEAGFRSREAGVMADLLMRNQLVLAAGGGAILNPETRQAIRAAGPAVWLTASLDTIASRLADDPTTTGRRPALTDQAPRSEIAAVLAIRAPLYAETASLTLNTEGRSATALVDEIVLALPGLIARRSR